ncbi:TIGR03663 family protein [Halapricum sp. CBA1109]|uniref:flippase activity-associated protein Agl23 n=1 Tax=Halapricum sp. CBA1109 TaxID=2668068 RepID=UPI0012FAD29D|nr:flippase activity-associated protein Agl23 [Halapricum sp. CBA1109]MUV88704.1 TIGR03663 family protein [Halapricum sp. CBA1109]
MTPPSNDSDHDPTADAGEAPDDATENNPSADATDSNTPADDTARPASADGTGGPPPDDRQAAVLDRVRRRPLLAAVLALTALALALRLVSLGSRAAHWDEARVAYWALYTHEQGSFAYRHIIHGPFVQHTSRWLFPLFGASDFTVRLPVAIVGGLLPLSALLFRKRLRRIEVGVLAAFLAFNPVFLYYSRFMRSDVLVGAFMFTALGLGVRFLDTRRPRYLYGIAAFVTLAIASKENAILYLVTWGGALVLLADRALDSPGSDRTGVDRLRTAAGHVRAVDYPAVGRRYLPHVSGRRRLALRCSSLCSRRGARDWRECSICPPHPTPCRGSGRPSPRQASGRRSSGPPSISLSPSTARGGPPRRS